MITPSPHHPVTPYISGSVMQEDTELDAVRGWLHRHQFDAYVSAFVQHKVAPRMLDKLSWRQVDKLIPWVGDQIRFREAVATISERGGVSVPVIPDDPRSEGDVRRALMNVKWLNANVTEHAYVLDLLVCCTARHFAGGLT